MGTSPAAEPGLASTPPSASPSSPSSRLIEVDALRGAGVLMFVLSNLVTDLDFFGVYAVASGSGWWWFARATAALFVLVAGVALHLSHTAARRRLGRGARARKYLRRGARLYGWGLAITAVTWVVVPQAYVRFGALHLLGAATLLALPLVRHRTAALVAGGALLALSQAAPTGPAWAAWLGLYRGPLTAVDYFPLLPWLGVFLLGTGAGGWLYPGGRRAGALRALRGWPGSWSAARPLRTPPSGVVATGRGLTWLGHRSLPIYLLHQPVLIALLVLLGVVPAEAVLP